MQLTSYKCIYAYAKINSSTAQTHKAHVRTPRPIKARICNLYISSLEQRRCYWEMMFINGIWHWSAISTLNALRLSVHNSSTRNNGKFTHWHAQNCYLVTLYVEYQFHGTNYSQLLRNLCNTFKHKLCQLCAD